MGTEHFDKWAENYTERILEELGEYKGQEHLDMLTTAALAWRILSKRFIKED